MSFEFGGHTWDGAFTDPARLEARSGVYGVWSRNGNDWKLLDIGESSDVQTRVRNHDRADQWNQHATGPLYYAATYTAQLHQAARMTIEQALRAAYRPPCGDR